jgi:hypothetical protein
MLPASVTDAVYFAVYAPRIVAGKSSFILSFWAKLDAKAEGGG